MDPQAVARVADNHRGCVRCVEAGWLLRAHPVFSAVPDARVLLVGQAPGPVEDDVTRPFAGRSGRQLMRWLVRAGFRDETEVRARVFMTSMTTCFPGRTPRNDGDRRPSAREVALCASWLELYLEHLQPRIVLSIGTLALGRFLPGTRLEEVVGEAWAAPGEIASAGTDRAIVPLPHPSGQSRWLNDDAHQRRLEAALDRLRGLLAHLAP
ncbi:MAG: uracil-DNA glycosylase family protein [Candidatus Dormibacteria bacterium]